MSNRFSRVCPCWLDQKLILFLPLALNSIAIDQVIAFELFSKPGAESTGVAFPSFLGSGPPLGILSHC
jgi:hypothetical protein